MENMCISLCKTCCSNRSSGCRSNIFLSFFLGTIYQGNQSTLMQLENTLTFVSTAQLNHRCVVKYLSPAVCLCLQFSAWSLSCNLAEQTFLHVGGHDQGSRAWSWHAQWRGRYVCVWLWWKAPTLCCLPLDLQTQRSNLQVDQSRPPFVLHALLFTSITHHHKPKHQMGEKPHKDLTVTFTKKRILQVSPIT